ncbi:Retinol dehydrogenase 13 [Coemansia sp. RSA 552]|nr:Retinol dehydrogenase 13 [Coemansia sp. RSA 552]
MGIASFVNWFQGTVSDRVLRHDNKAAQMLGFTPVWASDLLFCILNKFDVSGPSARSRIDRLVVDAGRDGANEHKLAIVTGANSGIGYETAKAIGRAGYKTILACRNEELGLQAVQLLERQTGLVDRYEFRQLDLASLDSIDKFVADIKAREEGVDLLVNNAGVMACPLSKTEDGLEMQFGVNHVGHFALTVGLLDKLREAARVINVSSLAAFMCGAIDYDALEDDNKYEAWTEYAYSKLANILFTQALARRLEGKKVTANSLHPGSVATDLTRHVGLGGRSRVQAAIEGALLDDVHTGSLTSIFLALSPDVEGQTGQFYARAMARAPHPAADNVAAQDRLWEYTESVISKARK